MQNAFIMSLRSTKPEIGSPAHVPAPAMVNPDIPCSTVFRIKAGIIFYCSRFAPCGN